MTGNAKFNPSPAQRKIISGIEDSIAAALLLIGGFVATSFSLLRNPTRIRRLVKSDDILSGAVQPLSYLTFSTLLLTLSFPYLFRNSFFYILRNLPSLFLSIEIKDLSLASLLQATVPTILLVIALAGLAALVGGRREAMWPITRALCYCSGFQFVLASGCALLSIATVGTFDRFGGSLNVILLVSNLAALAYTFVAPVWAATSAIVLIRGEDISMMARLQAAIVSALFWVTVSIAALFTIMYRSDYWKRPDVTCICGNADLTGPPVSEMNLLLILSNAGSKPVFLLRSEDGQVINGTKAYGTMSINADSHPFFLSWVDSASPVLALQPGATAWLKVTAPLFGDGSGADARLVERLKGNEFVADLVAHVDALTFSGARIKIGCIFNDVKIRYSVPTASSP